MSSVDAARLVFVIVGLGPLVLLLALVVSSLAERERRAALVSAGMTIAFALVWFGGGLLLQPPAFVLYAATGSMLLVVLLFFLPLSPARTPRTATATERVDERDVMFAREEYHPGSEQYAAYYAEHPEKQKGDDRLRRLPGFLEPGGRFYDEVASPRIVRIFERIEHLLRDVDGPVAAERTAVEATEISDHIKQLALRLGADDIGVARLNPMFVYSHVGRGPEPWGASINNEHSFGVAVGLEMHHDQVAQAPGLPLTNESALEYLKGARITIELACYIRSLGYAARAHIAGSNYQLMLPPVARDAGLGEMSRMGYLISPRFGARMRLGLVTTDLPLAADEPVVFGVREFCERCRKCADNCPPRAIAAGAMRRVRGVEKWMLDSERCIRFWRVIGTDCGLCMRVCPFSHPPTPVHNLIRAGIERSAFARQVSVWGDDLLYGRRLRWARGNSDRAASGSPPAWSVDARPPDVAQ